MTDPQQDPTKSLKDAMSSMADFMISGDLSKMPKTEKDRFIVGLATKIGVPPYPPAFMFVADRRGKETLVPTKHLAQALRDKYGITTEIIYQGALVMGDETDKSIYCVRVKGILPNGRSAEDMGTGCFVGDSAAGRGKADEILKTVTKAMNRVTYNLLGFGLLDETEVDSMREQGMLTGAPQPRQIAPVLPSVVTIEVVDNKEGLPVSGSPLQQQQ